MNNDSVLLDMKDMCKTFDQNRALDHVNFQLLKGEIHGLLGGNGAGKTTLMNVLYGLYKEDSGNVFMDGKKLDINSPKDAINNGVGMVHQHFLQIGNFSVIQNIVLGTKVTNRYSQKLEKEAETIIKLSERFNIPLDINANIEDLPMGTRQKVEILKALYRGVKILILDEPTTNLTPQEVDDLFQILRVMVNEGMSIVFITHKLREVISVCDRITVLRNGCNVVTLSKDEASEEVLVRSMVGDEMDGSKSILFSKKVKDDDRKELGNKEILRIENVSVIEETGITSLKNVSLTVHDGEIFGIAGVAGNGQRQLAEAIMGVKHIQNGKFLFNSEACLWTTNELMKRGITYIPEDRMEDGYLPAVTVAHNLILGYQKQSPYSKNGFIDWKKVFATSEQLIAEYNIKASGPNDEAGNLSGGNIQRVLIARAFSQLSNLLIAHNPTRGLDIRSMDFVYNKMYQLKKQGSAILLLSEDLDELILLCDRIGVLYRGEMVGVLERSNFEKYQIGRMMSGVRTDA